MREAKALRYAVRFKVILKYFGQICVVIAILTAVPMLVSLFEADTHICLRYLAVEVLLLGLGISLGRLSASRRIQINEAMVLAGLLFIFTPLVMTVPIMGSGIGFTDALFEAISGATTTGLSTLPTVEDKPASFLFSRAWMQWYGGLGIVVLSLALMVKPGRAAKGLSVTEAQSDDLVGGTRAHARNVLVIYTSLTVAAVIMIWAMTGRPFHALLYALAAVSTGGYAPHDNSLAGLGHWPAHTTVLLACFSGAVSLMLYYQLYKRRWRETLEFLQLRSLLTLGILITVALGLCMFLSGVSWPMLLSHAPFMAFSAQSTAGFSTMEISSLDSGSKLILIIAMVVGGGLGSTAGGFKIFRLLVFLQICRLMVVRTCLATGAVFQPRLAGNRLNEEMVRDGLLIIILFVAVIILSWLPFLIFAYDPLDALFEVVSATGTVGLSTGIVREELPTGLKGVLCADMLMGRLEILMWIVFFSPRTWIGRRLKQ